MNISIFPAKVYGVGIEKGSTLAIEVEEYDSDLKTTHRKALKLSLPPRDRFRFDTEGPYSDATEFHIYDGKSRVYTLSIFDHPSMRKSSAGELIRLLREVLERYRTADTDYLISLLKTLSEEEREKIRKALGWW